ncbi:M56 family metallopeptidase [Anoxybacterium hadale]|uniref:M56 family metallopeptidase n=1 Tax=Anoxybacterium hadale TaxID=3408580 RepID=A0ACD1AFF1_9FIRM|nr:M56 family metallopeptidase [Clostridiales bacterium]
MEHNLIGLFLTLFNMSITASAVILIVLLLRLMLIKAPKVFSYGLWSIVFFRLFFPASISSSMSLLRFLPSGVIGRTSAVSPPVEVVAPLPFGTPAAAGTGTPEEVTGRIHDAGVLLQNLQAGTQKQSYIDSLLGQGHPILTAMTILWLTGVAVLLLYSAWSYAKLKGRLSTALWIEENIFESDLIQSPCVVGFFHPGIYLPSGISGPERQYILRHENIHIRRFDYLLKPLAFLALCLHWFNPLVWISYRLMGRDMEMSCDESVLRGMGLDIKKAYSSSLLSFATPGGRLSGSPLAFGEETVSKRIKNILNYRKPPVWIAVGLIIALIITAISLVTDPKTESALEGQPAATSFSQQDLYTMSETWAEALKTRNGEPRYEMMSAEMKKQFIKEQKERSEPWNFNIGVSSPWVTDYKVTVNGDTAEIIYMLTDSSQSTYEQKEVLLFGKEDGKTVVVKADELLSDYERYSYHAPSAEQALEVYRGALMESNYLTILSITPSAPLDPYGQIIWDTIKISKVRVITQDVRQNKACYELELTIDEGGSSAFETGSSPRWLWLSKDALGWYVEGLMTGGAPDADWWSQPATADPFFGDSQWTEATYRFDKILYLSPLSSATLDYAENRMKEAQCIIGTERFSIDNPNENNHYEIASPIYIKSEFTEQMTADFEKSTFQKISIKKYKEKYRYNVFTGDHKNTNYCFYLMDNELWLASYADNTADGSEIIMTLWKLK